MGFDPVVLFFVFGLLAGLLKSELKLPPALYETLSIVLLLAIGLHGGVELAEQASVALLAQHGVAVEPVRVDPFTGALFTFLADPDGLPIELVGPAPAVR